MTATLLTTGETLEHERIADYRLSARQHDMLKTLNMLFEERSPTQVEATAKEEFNVIPKSSFEAGDVSRFIRM